MNGMPELDINHLIFLTMLDYYASCKLVCLEENGLLRVKLRIEFWSIIMGQPR
jgi:hypothetical protein